MFENEVEALKRVTEQECGAVPPLVHGHVLQEGQCLVVSERGGTSETFLSNEDLIVGLEKAILELRML